MDDSKMVTGYSGESISRHSVLVVPRVTFFQLPLSPQDPGWPCSGPLLKLAEDAATRLLPAFDTPTGESGSRRKGISSSSRLKKESRAG